MGRFGAVRGGRATHDAAKEPRVVVAHFHTSRYSARCRLTRVPSKSGEKPVSFQSEPLREAVRGKVWAAAFRDTNIPAGQYILESHLKKGNATVPFQQLVQVDHAYRNVTGVSGSGSRPKVKHLARAKAPVLFEPLVVDGVSLEEAFLRQFGYKYSEGMLSLLNSLAAKKDADLTMASFDDQRFATFVGVVQAMHDRVAAAAGWLKTDNEYFKVYDNIKDIYKESSWAKTNEAIEELKAEDLETPARRFGRKEWQEKMGSVLKPVDVVGKALNVYSHGADIFDLYQKHLAATKAELSFGKAASGFHRSRATVDGALSQARGGWFSRGELLKLESLCQAADNQAGEALVAGTAFVFDMVGCALGLFFPGGFLAECFGQAAEIGSKVVEVISQGLKWADELAFDSELSNRWRDIKEWWHDLGARAHNDAWALRMRFARGVSTWDTFEYRLQFLYRAKVLYGLMRLIAECGPYKDNESDFRAKTRELRIQQYIDRFVLGGPFWVRNDHLGVDWVDYFHLQKDAAARGEVVRLSKQKNDGSHYQGWNKYGPHGWTEVDFQRWFPIHFMDHANAFELARDLCIDYGTFSDDDVATTFWQRADKVRYDKKHAAQGGTGLIVTRWETLKDNEQVDSETPVRAVMALKGKPNAKDRRFGVPVTFQLYRVDGRNASGPEYSTATRRLTERDLLPKVHKDRDTGKQVPVRGCMGAIVEFDYYYTWKDHEPAKVYRGLKPMKGWYHSTIVQPMDMSAWWTLARNEGQEWLADGQEVRMVWLSKGVVPKDNQWEARNFSKFSDGDFLKRDTSQEKHKASVLEDDVKLIIQTSNDRKTWRQLIKGQSVAFNQPLRVVIKVKKRAHYTSGVPASVQLVRTDGDNASGPIYRTGKMHDLKTHGMNGWGAVIELWFYVVDNSGFGPQAIKEYWGVKPLMFDPYHDYAKISYRGFTFDLRCTVGDSWSSPKTAKPDDIPFALDGTQDGDLLSAPVVSGQRIRPYFVFEADGGKRKALVLGGGRDEADKLLKEAVSRKFADPEVLADF